MTSRIFAFCLARYEISEAFNAFRNPFKKTRLRWKNHSFVVLRGHKYTLLNFTLQGWELLL